MKQPPRWCQVQPYASLDQRSRNAGDRPERNRFITFADNHESEPSAGVSGNCLARTQKKREGGFAARRPVTMQPRCGFFRFLQPGLRRCAPTDRLALLAFCSIGAHPGRPWSDGRDGAERVCGHYQSPALMVASNTSSLSSQSSSWHRGWATFAQTSLYEPSSGMVCK